MTTTTDRTAELDEYRAAMALAGLSPRTVEARFMFAKRLLRSWPAWEVGPGEVAEFLGRYSGHTKRTYHDHFVAVFSWLERTGRIEASPMADVVRPPTPRPRPRPLAREDAARSLLAAEGDLRAYLLLGRYAGLRAHEIAKFRGEDIDSTSLYVFGKGGQGAVLPTHPVLWELAESYPRRGYWFTSERSSTGHVTGHSVTMRVSRHFARLGIDGSSHRNRHLYGTNLLRAGANLRVVQELMRHADLATTVRYLGVDEEEKAAAIRALVA